MTSTNSTAILTVATGKYFSFLNQLLKGIKSNSNSKNHLTVFVFTDNKQSKIHSTLNIEKIYWNKTNWPDPTLLRYHGFSIIEEQLFGFSNILYLDVDMKVNSELPIAPIGKLLAIQHPGYVKVERAQFEENSKSNSYLEPKNRKVYVCGGVQGGSTNVYLAAINEIKKWVDADINTGISARWHDESYWNKYINLNMDKSIIMGREYCWPEQWQTKKTPGKIIALKKNHANFRNDNNFYRKFRFFLSDIRMKLIRPRAY